MRLFCGGTATEQVLTAKVERRPKMKRLVGLVVMVLFIGASVAMASDGQKFQDLEKRIAELEAQQQKQTMQNRNVELLQEMV